MGKICYLYQPDVVCCQHGWPEKLMLKEAKFFRKARMCEEFVSFLEMGNRKIAHIIYLKVTLCTTFLSNFYHSSFIAINLHRFCRMKIWKIFLHDVFSDDDFDESYYTARNDLNRLLPPTKKKEVPGFDMQDATTYGRNIS
jgi:hypothetical protein